MSVITSTISEYSDEELCALVASGRRDAEEELVKRYLRPVRVCARPYFLAGGDSEDLIQEAMFGLLKAIREFDPGRDARFKTFAEVCIRNRIRSAVTNAARSKHAPLNDSVPFESPMLGVGLSLEEQYISREEETELLVNLEQRLSQLERRVLTLFLLGLSYQEISEQVGRSIKSVDNAVQRIRRKVAGDFGVFSES
ncbi:MAG: sigma-70 family RNA polymerase sigma factor [Clostridiales bacterium]|nr:sigma-70 family RNA polymerase sigma factor [Clostridiales bacterium]